MLLNDSIIKILKDKECVLNFNEQLMSKVVGIDKYKEGDLREDLIKFIKEFIYSTDSNNPSILQKSGFISRRIGMNDEVVKGIKVKDESGGFGSFGMATYTNPLELKIDGNRDRLTNQFKDLEKQTDIELIAKALSFVNSIKTVIDRNFSSAIDVALKIDDKEQSDSLRKKIQDIFNKHTASFRGYTKAFKSCDLYNSPVIKKEENQKISQDISRVKSEFKGLKDEDVLELARINAFRKLLLNTKDNLISSLFYEFKTRENITDYANLYYHEDKSAKGQHKDSISLFIDLYSEPYEVHLSKDKLDEDIRTYFENLEKVQNGKIKSKVLATKLVGKDGKYPLKTGIPQKLTRDMYTKVVDYIDKNGTGEGR